MLTTRQARTHAKEINAKIRAREPFDMKAIMAMTFEDRELVLKYCGLEHKLYERRAARAAADPITAQRSHGGYTVSRADDRGECVTYRAWVKGTITAARQALMWDGEPPHEDYSPTGKWFWGRSHWHRARGDIWVVIGHRYLDC